MRKTALGVALALVLAALPLSLFATTAAADSSTTIHVINGYVGNQSIDVYLNGVQVADNLATGGGIDVSVDPSVPQILNACTANSDHVANDGDCLDSSDNPVTQIGENNQDLGSLDSGANYTLLIEGAYSQQPATLFSANDLSLTGLGEFRYTLHVSGLVGQPYDVCIGGVKVLSNVPNGSSGVADVTAQQDAPYAIFASTGDASCASPQANVSFAAGTNFVQTLAATQVPTCSSGCVQVLLVGQSTVPNNPDTVAFCSSILDGPDSLSGFQPALKALVGDVDPTSTATIKNTQPSYGDMKSFVATYQGVLDAGDASVPPSVTDAWSTATAGIRTLLTTFQLASYDLSNLPPDAVQNIVLGANGIQLPGVPPNQDVVAAQEAITNFVTGTCLASPTPGPTPGPTPAAPVNAVAKFTG